MIVKIRKHIKKVFPLLALLLVAVFVLSRVYSPDPPRTPEIFIDATEASDYVGEFAQVCGYVASARFATEIGGQPTFLNFDRPHPNQVFTVVIWGEHRLAWRTPPEELYQNRTICVTGRIRLHDDVPQIVIQHPDKISLP